MKFEINKKGIKRFFYKWWLLMTGGIIALAVVQCDKSLIIGVIVGIIYANSWEELK